ncbi:hypothetical protein [Rouxiella sp. WC2420]|uniref:Uncharacterized protein n=1 Tax=Rouxiella sp. WC2420 TaxID=3234145 RepID=A0AB39VM33_9GAMM
MNKETALDLIIFSPCSWINPQRLVVPEMFSEPECLSILNKMVIEHYGLSTDFKKIESSSFVDVVVTNWSSLPQIAHLLACRYHQAALNYQGLMCEFSKAIQNFCSGPSGVTQPVLLGKHVCTETLEITSLSLLLSLSPVLPKSIVQRIPLLFSELCSENIGKKNNASITVLDFKLALQYAKNHRLF